MSANPFAHPALFYRTPAGYADQLGRFIHGALEGGHPVAVAVPKPNLDLLREHVGPGAAREVQWIDMFEAGRNPGRIIPMVLLATARAHPGRRAHIIGEPIWAGRTQAEYPACAQHEALINDAFAGRDAIIVCPYDESALEPSVLADALHTHPTLTDAGRTWTSPGYDVQAWRRFNPPLGDPPEHALRVDVADNSDLVLVRKFATELYAACGMPGELTSRLVQAVSEVATNTVVHGDNGGRVSLWFEQRALVAQVDSEGGMPALSGRIPPADGGPGYGLIVANVLCDLVCVHFGESATAVRMWVSSPP